jgi:hypothetical protein
MGDLRHDGVDFDLPPTPGARVQAVVLGLLAPLVLLAGLIAWNDGSSPSAPRFPVGRDATIVGAHPVLEGWRTYATHDLESYSRVRRDALFTAYLHGVEAAPIPPGWPLQWHWAEAVHLAVDPIPPRSVTLDPAVIAIHDQVDDELERAREVGWEPADDLSLYAFGQASVRKRLASATGTLRSHPQVGPEAFVDRQQAVAGWIAATEAHLWLRSLVAAVDAARLLVTVMLACALLVAARGSLRGRRVRLARGVVEIDGQRLAPDRYRAEAIQRRVQITLQDGTVFDTPDLGFNASRMVAAALIDPPVAAEPAPEALIALRAGRVRSSSGTDR